MPIPKKTGRKAGNVKKIIIGRTITCAALVVYEAAQDPRQASRAHTLHVNHQGRRGYRTGDNHCVPLQQQQQQHPSVEPQPPPAELPSPPPDPAPAKSKKKNTNTTSVSHTRVFEFGFFLTFSQTKLTEWLCFRQSTHLLFLQKHGGCLQMS